MLKWDAGHGTCFLSELRSIKRSQNQTPAGSLEVAGVLLFTGSALNDLRDGGLFTNSLGLEPEKGGRQGVVFARRAATA